MSGQFVMRAVHGSHVGNYYAGNNGLSANWVSDAESAERLSPTDAAGIAMAMLDTQCIAVAPEVIGECSESEKDLFSMTMALGCFQSRDGGMAETIRMGIRDSASDPIYPQSSCPEPTGGFMSVWEWVMRAMVARLGDNPNG